MIPDSGAPRAAQAQITRRAASVPTACAIETRHGGAGACRALRLWGHFKERHEPVQRDSDGWYKLPPRSGLGRRFQFSVPHFQKAQEMGAHDKKLREATQQAERCC